MRAARWGLRPQPPESWLRPLSALWALLVVVVVLPAACGDSGTASPQAYDAGADVAVEAATPGACVTSPVPAPFPTGACPVAQPAAKDAVDEALAAMGLDRCTLHINLDQASSGLMSPRDKRAVPGFADLLAYPLRLPAWGAETTRWMDDALASDMPVSRALAAAAVRQGGAVSDCPDPGILAVDPADDAPLATALAAAGADRDASAPAVAAVPIALQRALAPIVQALAWARGEVLAARGSADPRELDLAPDFVMGTGRLGLTNDMVAHIASFDVARVVRASVVIATAIESAHLAEFAGAMVPSLDLATPIGAVVLRGPGNDVHAAGSASDGALLVLDTGGDDTYTAPVGAATPRHVVSVAIDLDGKDRYAYDEKPVSADNVGMRLPSDADGRSGGLTLSRVGRQGSGNFGVGMLFDLGEGNDTYRSLAMSQGAAVFGVGVLYDHGGDDTYEAEVLAQGAAGWGVGLLLDRAGKDTYRAYSAAQGYGFTGGVGALVDADGDDTYTTDPGDPALGGDPLYPNAQLPKKGNTSMSQGVGRGTRPDSPEPGFALPGGLGILRDSRGNDRYTTSVFGQASGFAMGVGILSDGAGDDTYEGLWYVQGADAHTSLALFVDGAGNDRYNPTFPIAATSIGVGHDFSVAIHLDLGGDDAYHAPGLALGAGNTNGVGILANVGGTDVFESTGGLILGAASASEVMDILSRRAMPTVGLFVKAGGATTYKVGAQVAAAPGATWTTTPDRDAGANELAAGIDRPQGTATFP